MNAEKALAYKIQNPDLLVVSGSRLYGTARYDDKGNCLSDTDLRGVVVPPWEYLTVRNFDQTNIPNEVDGIVYGLGYFFKNLISCNPQMLEILFVNQNNILKMSDLGKEIMSLRDIFVSKRFYKRIFGFSNSEFRKCRMVELEVSERTKTEDDVVNDIRNVFGPLFGEQQKEKMDDVLSILFSCHSRKEIPSAHKVTGKRKAEFERYGYGTSSACHSLRLVRQCTELLKTGKMTFPRPDAQELSDVKHGRMTLQDFEPIYYKAVEEAESAVKESTLPERPDEAKARAYYEKVVADALLSDSRLQGYSV